MRAMLLAVFALFLPAPALAQASDPNAPQGKLPATAAPIAYRLDLTVIPEQPRFTGHAEIDIELKQPAASIYLHARDLNVSRAVAVVGGKPIPVTFTQVTPTGAARLDFGKTMAPGKMTLRFDYDGAFGDNPSGLYRVKVDQDWYSWTQFQSIDARAAFPSFDEPGFKTPFTVSLTTKPGFVALSNAPQTGSKPVGALVRHDFAATKPLPTYLVAFVVGPFITAETQVAPTPQRDWPLPVRIVATRANAGKLDFALHETGKIVALLEKYFDEPFPFPKLDQIGSPVMPGAMENAGADIYGDGILLLGDDATTEEKQAFGMIVAHELSHQWFGDLVTPVWWDDIWLNESFANWMGYRIGNEWRPDLNIGVDAIDEALGAMGTDALAAGRPIHERIVADNAIDAAFDNITYGKGGQVVAMIAAYLGDEKFRDGVRLHMKRHAYGNASTDDFWSSLAAAAHDPRVLKSLQSFVDQQGVPVVRFTTSTGASLNASQSAYAFYGATPAARQWTIPVCVRRATTRSCTLLDSPSGTIAAPGNGALIPNAGGEAYYRFELDEAGWAAINREAASLPAGEALTANDSLWASFYAGRGKVSQLIDASRAFAANPDSNVALDNGERLAGLDRRGLVSEAAKPGYRKLLASIYRPMLDKLGSDLSAGAYANDDPDRQKLRQDVVDLLSGPGHDAALRALMVKAADAYLAGDTRALDPGFLGLALTIAAEERDDAFARKLVERALASQDPGFRRAALGAAVSNGNKATANWFLNEFRDDRLRGVERLFLTGALINGTATSDIAVTYLIDSYDQLSAGNGIFMASRIPAFFGNLCTLEEADRIEAKLGAKIAALGAGVLNFQRSIERIRNCARIKAARTGEVSAALAAVR